MCPVAYGRCGRTFIIGRWAATRETQGECGTGGCVGIGPLEHYRLTVGNQRSDGARPTIRVAAGILIIITRTEASPSASSVHGQMGVDAATRFDGDGTIARCGERVPTSTGPAISGAGVIGAGAGNGTICIGTGGDGFGRSAIEAAFLTVRLRGQGHQ